ncbi:MAG: MFS transporter [Methanobacterium sp.]|nr:MFS transporter [Methanobacterium sp.]
MGYLICSKCKSYYKLQTSESAKDFMDKCVCGGKLRYLENLDIVDPKWKQVLLRKKPTKREFLRKKIQSIFSFPKMNTKEILHQFYYNNIGKHIYNIRNQNRIHRTLPGMGIGINAILNEFNLYNIQWLLVVPVTILIVLILKFTQGISILLIFILLSFIGYLSKNIIIGTKNAAITGAISFFLGSLLIGSFLIIIPYTILGIINGAVCGLIGWYLKKKLI